MRVCPSWSAIVRALRHPPRESRNTGPKGLADCFRSVTFSRRSLGNAWDRPARAMRGARRNRDAAWADRLAARVDFPLYLLDASAIRVRGDKVDVVSTWRWRLVGQ